MAQMSKEELWNWILSSPYASQVTAGRNPGTLSLQTGANEGYITQFNAPPGFYESQVADVANPAGFNTPYMTPADWQAQIANMTYVPDWQQAMREANNGGMFADYPLAPLMVAGGGLLYGGLGGAGAGAGAGAADAGLYGFELGGEGIGAAVGGAETAGSAMLPSSVGNLFGTGSAAYNPATASVADIVGAVSASGGNAIPVSALTPELAAAVSSGATVASLSPSLLSQLASTVSNATGTTITGGQLLGAGASILGGILSGQAGQGAAETSANAQLEAARIAADAAKFRPVGVTTRFGQSNFQKDAAGNVIGAGYTLSPDIKAQQDALLAASGQMLPQYAGSLAATAPMGDAAQRMMSLGNQYLATDPQAQAAKYLADQQALLATGRERDVAGTLAGEFNRGTYGLATGGTSTGMMAANPRLEALYNAQRQQDLGLAAQATQGGMEYAKFGGALTGSGGDMLRSMYGTQAASLQPWQTGMNAAQYLEGLGQQPLTLGMDIGRTVTGSNAAAGGLLAQGMLGAAQTQQAASYSPWGTALMGAGNAIGSMGQQAQQQAAQQQQNQMLMAALGNNSAPTSGFTDWSYNGSWY